MRISLNANEVHSVSDQISRLSVRTFAFGVSSDCGARQLEKERERDTEREEGGKGREGESLHQTDSFRK